MSAAGAVVDDDGMRAFVARLALPELPVGPQIFDFGHVINEGGANRIVTPYFPACGEFLGAIGNGMGIGPGQFIEASYWVMDKDDNLYAGDTAVGRVTKMIAPRK